MKPTPDEVESRLTTKTPRLPAVSDVLLSTGSTQLNLAFSGRPHGGIPPGTFLYIVGDSGALKSWTSFSVFAEAARNKHFDKYCLVYDGPENGAWMDVPHFFGKKAAERIVPPRGTRKRPDYSRTVQEFYYNLDAVLDAGPVVYVEDSMDALNADEDEEKFAAERRRHETGKGDVPGSMGMAKAKTNSKNINRVVRRLLDTGSILIVISQTRDKINSHIPGQKTRGGGRALKFYAHLEVWTSVRGPIMSPRYRGKEREIGSRIRIDVQKNRVNGWEGAIELPFLKGFGIDDTGGCVEYLLEERHWKYDRGRAKGDEGEETEGKTFSAPEFAHQGTREQLIQKIQQSESEHELRLLVANVWRDIQQNAAPVRKPRYS